MVQGTEDSVADKALPRHIFHLQQLPQENLDTERTRFFNCR